MRPWMAFALGVAAYYVFEHFFTAPKMPAGKYGKGGAGG
jgi:hypothetical protein